MKVEIARIYKLEGKSSIKAFADIVVENCFLIKGIKVIEGKNGLFVGMPSKLGKDGKAYITAFPITKEGRKELVTAVLEAYEI